MSVPQTVASILYKHVTLAVESSDRLYLNVYVPKSQRTLGVGRTLTLCRRLRPKSQVPRPARDFHRDATVSKLRYPRPSPPLRWRAKTCAPPPVRSARMRRA